MLSGRGRSPSGGQLLPPGTVAPPLSYPARPRGPRAHLEVDRVHSQNVGVQLAQLGQGAGDVVNVPDRVAHGRHDLGAVRAQMRRAAVQVEVWEVGLGLGVAGEEPAGWGRGVSSRKEQSVYLLTILPLFSELEDPNSTLPQALKTWQVPFVPQSEVSHLSSTLLCWRHPPPQPNLAYSRSQQLLACLLASNWAWTARSSTPTALASSPCHLPWPDGPPSIP